MWWLGLCQCVKPVWLLYVNADGLQTEYLSVLRGFCVQFFKEPVAPPVPYDPSVCSLVTHTPQVSSAPTWSEGRAAATRSVATKNQRRMWTIDFSYKWSVLDHVTTDWAGGPTQYITKILIFYYRFTVWWILLSPPYHCNLMFPLSPSHHYITTRSRLILQFERNTGFHALCSRCRGLY